jgi:DNA recombination protein RmuC
MVELAFLIAGIALGAAVTWLLVRARLTGLQVELDHERTAAAEKISLLEGAKEGFETTMKALAADALRSSNESFLQLAKTQLEQKEKAVEHLVAPLKESLDRVGREVETLERERQQTVGALTAGLKAVTESNERVRLEAASLSTALRSPEVRGAWGQMQLRNAVEAAGMLAYCDFVEEVTVTGGEGRLRPDLVVRLPAGRYVVVDAKAPLRALQDASRATDDAVHDRLLRDFARHVREHVAKLSAKQYWQQFDPTPDFVIMFLPGESFYRTAVQHDPSLLELTPGQRVILASPTTLITLLKTIAVGWREERVADSARAVSELGRELYERLGVMTDHLATLGKRLDGAVAAYNQSVGSLERRVLPQARRFVDHGVTVTRELPGPSPIERTAQPPQTAELPAARGDSEPPSLPAVDAA